MAAPQETDFCTPLAKFPRTPSSAGVLLAFCSDSGVLAFSFWRSAPWRSALAFWGGLAFWVWRSGGPGVLGLAFWSFWRSGSGFLGVLAFWLAFCPGVLGAGVLQAFWRSALAFCRRSGVLQAFWRSAWRSSVLPCILLSLRRLSRHAACVCDFEAT